MVAVGVIVMVGVKVIVAVGLAVGVGVGIFMIVGVGVGVMIVFCCSSVLVISTNCLLRTADWEYIKIEAEIPTPASIKRIKVKSDEVGPFGKFVGITAGWGSGLGVNIGSGETTGVGGTGVCGLPLSKLLKGLLGGSEGFVSSGAIGEVGSSSGVGSNSGGVEIGCG